MKFILPLMILLLTGFMNCHAQYSEYPLQSDDNKPYTRSEIRRHLLNAEDMDPEVYKMAIKSRRSTIWSVPFYTIGGFYFASGLGTLVVGGLIQDDVFLGAVGLMAMGVGTVGLGLGAWQTHVARKRLDRALELHYP